MIFWTHALPVNGALIAGNAIKGLRVCFQVMICPQNKNNSWSCLSKPHLTICLLWKTKGDVRLNFLAIFFHTVKMNGDHGYRFLWIMTSYQSFPNTEIYYGFSRLKIQCMCCVDWAYLYFAFMALFSFVGAPKLQSIIFLNCMLTFKRFSTILLEFP